MAGGVLLLLAEFAALQPMVTAFGVGLVLIGAITVGTLVYRESRRTGRGFWRSLSRAILRCLKAILDFGF